MYSQDGCSRACVTNSTKGSPTRKRVDHPRGAKRLGMHSGES